MLRGKDKILITGADGFLGFEIFKFLVKKYDVVGTSKKKSKIFFKLNYPKDSINKINLDNVNTVLHLASPDRQQSKQNFFKSKKINLEFTEKLINRCIDKKVKRFIYFSSIGVYGNNLKKKVSELRKPLPNDNYSKIKYIVEKKILKKKKINIIIIRISNIIGTPSKVSKGFRKLFLADICLSAIEKNKIILKSDGNQFRDFLDLRILLKIILKILKKKTYINKNYVFNVSSGRSIKVLEVANYVKDIMKKNFNKQINIYTGKSSNENYYEILNNKLNKQFKINTNYNLNKTILNIIKFLYKNGKKLS